MTTVSPHVRKDNLSSACYDRETEVLTPSGWTRFDALVQGAPVAQVALNTLEMSFVVPTSYIQFPYQGGMYHWRNKSFDLKVTPDHRMVALSEWKFDKERLRQWQITPAHALPARFYVPQAVAWNAPDVESVLLAGKVIPGDDYAALMGMWIAEGCTRESGRDVVISQNSGKSADAIWELLQCLPYGFGRSFQRNGTHIHFRSFDKGLYAALRPFGKSGDKYVPLQVKQMSARQIQWFLDWYELGDGYRAERNELQVMFVSKSHRLIDDVQELLLRIGRTGAVQRYAKCSRLQVRSHKREGENGYKWYSKLQPEDLTREWMEDEVFCVSVPTGAVLVRRNKRPAVSGNCMEIRGIRTPGLMTSSVTRGLFREDNRARLEFLQLVRGSGQ